MKISIVIPSFNQATFIGRTIESILSLGGNFEVELIIMDGGSTDESVEIIKKYEYQMVRLCSPQVSKSEKKHPFKLIWESKKDKGQSDAINQGLKKATGDIIAYLNSDDAYEPGCFAKVIEEFKKNPKKMWLTGYCRIIDENDKTIQPAITKYKNFWLRHYSRQTLLVLNYIAQPATFWRREIFEEFGGFDESLHLTMDYDYWLKISKKYEPIIVPQFLADFRIHGSSKGGKQYIKQFDEDLSTVKKYTNNFALICLHGFHNWLIKQTYRRIK